MSNAGDFAKELSDLEALYNNTKPVSEDIVPDNVYQLKIEEINLTMLDREESGRKFKIPCVVTKYRIAAGDFKDKTITTWDRLNNDKGISFFKEKMKRLGKDPNAPLSLLEVELSDLQGTIVTAEVKSSKGQKGDMIFTNVYVRKNDGKDTTVPF